MYHRPPIIPYIPLHHSADGFELHGLHVPSVEPDVECHKIEHLIEPVGMRMPVQQRNLSPHVTYIENGRDSTLGTVIGCYLLSE